MYLWVCNPQPAWFGGHTGLPTLQHHHNSHLKTGTHWSFSVFSLPWLEQEHTGLSVSSASPGWNRNTLETLPRVLHKYSHYIQFRKLIFGDVIVFSVLDNSIQTKLSTSYFTSQAYHGWPAGTGTHWKLSHRSFIATIIIFHHKHFYFLVVL